MGLKVEIGAGDKTRLFNEFCSKTRPGRFHIQESEVQYRHTASFEDFLEKNQKKGQTLFESDVS